MFDRSRKGRQIMKQSSDKRNSISRAAFPVVMLIWALVMIPACAVFLFGSSADAAGRTRLRAEWVSLTRTSYVCNGKSRKPEVKIVRKGSRKAVQLIQDRDYTVTYRYNRKPGTARAVVRGKGRYRGTVELTFRIRPAIRQIRSVSVTQNTIRVKWLRAMDYATGYQLQFSPDSACKTNTGSFYYRVDSKKGKYLTASLQDLEPDTRYFLRLRAYRTLGGVYYYGPWSKVMAVGTGRPEDPETESLSLSFEQGRVMYRDELYHNVQGLCTDHRSSLYIALREGGDNAYHDSRPTMLRRINRKGTVLVSNKNKCYCHANGITYCGKDGNLYIATLGRTVNAEKVKPGKISPQQHNVIGVADGQTLAFRRFFSVEEQILSLGIGHVRVKDGEDLECPYISSVHYDADRDIFICPLKQYRLIEDDTVMHQGIVIFDGSWNLTDYIDYPYPRMYTANAAAHGGRYYLCLNVIGTREKKMTVLDQDFRKTGTVILPAACEDEFECADWIGDTLYGSFNTSRVTVEAFDLMQEP